jgi:hypothetical protein
VYPRKCYYWARGLDSDHTFQGWFLHYQWAWVQVPLTNGATVPTTILGPFASHQVGTDWGLRRCQPAVLDRCSPRRDWRLFLPEKTELNLVLSTLVTKLACRTGRSGQGRDRISNCHRLVGRLGSRALTRRLALVL